MRRKAINFDLDTKRMRIYGVYPRGYNDIANSLLKRGFEHRQGSGYVSINPIRYSDVTRTIVNVVKENEWLEYCINKLDVTEVGKCYDLTRLVKTCKTQQVQPAKQAELVEQVQQVEQVRQAEQVQQVGQVRQVTALTKDDKAVLQAITNSATGKTFNDIVQGQYDKSDKATEYVMNTLNFFTNGNVEQMKRIYQSTSIYDPVKGGGYISKAVSKAIKASTHDRQTPLRVRNKGQGKGR